MESTGIYWLPLFEILEEAGLEVILVNARHVKNVPGRKTDVLDSQWIQQLHSYGLLSGVFQPDQMIDCAIKGLYASPRKLDMLCGSTYPAYAKSVALNES